MSDPDLESKDELKKSLEEFQLKKRLSSSSDDVFSPFSSPRGPSVNTEANTAGPQPSTSAAWTVVDVSPPQPKEDASKVVIERAKPPVPTKPKPPPPPKTKPKSPSFDRSKELSSPKSPVTSTASNEKPGFDRSKELSFPKSPVTSTASNEKPGFDRSKELSFPKSPVTSTASNEKPDFDRSKPLSAIKSPDTSTASHDKPIKVAPPKRVSDYEEIRTDGVTGKEELPKLELRSDTSESNVVPSTSPNGGVKSILSVFEGGNKDMPAYAKPDMFQKKPKSFFTSENKAHSVIEKTEKEENIVEETPAIPDRKYTEEDLSSLSPTSKPSPPPPPIRNSSPETSPKQNHFNASRASTSPSQGFVENEYEVVEPRKEKPPVAPAPPFHQHRIESRKDMPPAPPSPFRDRGPAPPVRDVSLSSSSKAPSVVTVESDYAEVTEAVRRPLVNNETLYSEVEDTARIPEVEAYFTTDVVRNLPTKSGEATKRVPPPKPLPYKLKNALEGESQLQTSSDPNPVKKPPPKPAPYQPKNKPGNLPNQAALPNENRLQSPVSPSSPRLPTVMPGSPRLASAKVVSDSAPSSTSSSPSLERSSRAKPPPPPRVSSIADATKEEVTQPSQSSIEGNRLNSYSPVNGVLERFDKNEIPTRDSGAALPSKPKLAPKPQLDYKMNLNAEDHGPPSFKPPPPPKLSPLIPRAYGVKSGSVSPDRERARSQNGTYSFGIVTPPPLEWMDGKSERSPSKTSVDSLDLKIVPPPPVHFKALDNNNESQFDFKTVNPPSGWQEGIEDTRIRSIKKGSWKISGENEDFDLAIVPPPPPSEPPPTLPLSGPLDYELDLVPSPLTDGPGGLNIEDILGNLDNTLSAHSDDEDFLPPAPLPPGERYAVVPPPPVDGVIKPLVPPLRKQR